MLHQPLIALEQLTFNIFFHMQLYRGHFDFYLGSSLEQP